MFFYGFRIAFRDKKKYVNLAKPSLLCEKLIWFRDNIDNTIEQYTQDTLSSLIEKYVIIIHIVFIFSLIVFFVMKSEILKYTIFLKWYNYVSG